MAKPVRALLIGAGLVGQVSHLVTLTDKKSHIQLAGIIDASASRAKTLGEKHSVPYAASLEKFVGEYDAVVIATPDPSHYDLVKAALKLGKHVFCEKPLGLSRTEVVKMERLAEASKSVALVGYMKRFDPAVDALKNHIKENKLTIQSIAVEVRDPDAAPFVKNVPFVQAGDDVDTKLIRDGNKKFMQVAKSVLSRNPKEAELTAYGSFTSALIHDLNLARFILNEELKVISGAYSMEGKHVCLALLSKSGVMTRISHTQNPAVPDYAERFTIYCDKGIYEMTFPAPYLLNKPTELIFYGTSQVGFSAKRESLYSSTEEAFYLELQNFADIILKKKARNYENSFSTAKADAAHLEVAFKFAAGTKR